MEKGGLDLSGHDTVPGFAEEMLKHLAGLLCSFSQSSEHDRQTRNFLLPGLNPYAHCNMGHFNIVIVNLPVFQFLVLSSVLLLPQEAQMLVALGWPLSCPWVPSRVCGFLSPAVVCSFLWDMLCPVLCRSTFSAWVPLPAGFRRQFLTTQVILCSTSAYSGLIIWKCRFFRPCSLCMHLTTQSWLITEVTRWFFSWPFSEDLREN